jgi:dipeptidyl aminopeptidase/acylaminoacyl peptidase
LYCATDESGVPQLWTWDRQNDRHRQVTDRPEGTRIGMLAPSGKTVWWFADSPDDPRGRWMRAPFEGGTHHPAARDLEPGYPAGLALGTTVAVVGLVDTDGTTISLVRSGASDPFHFTPQHAQVGNLSRDEKYISISFYSDTGPQIEILQIDDGAVVATMTGEPIDQLSPIAFMPIENDEQLLISRVRRGQHGLVLWDPIAGTLDELDLDLPGTIEADWYPDGSALLICHDSAGRSELYRYQIATRTYTPVHTPGGVIRSVSARPDGTVEFDWSSAATPPEIRSSNDEVVLPHPGGPVAPSVPLESLWIDGPGGAIHALVAYPGHLLPPYATVFSVHDGPYGADEDSFSPRRAALVDAGYCVVHVNYRGSRGYGNAWRDAVSGPPGFSELEDIAAVWEWLVQRHRIDPKRCVIEGEAWGALLALLAAGTQPDYWSAIIATAPLTDHAAAHGEAVPALRGFLERLLGGDPQNATANYERCSPITYAEKIQAPVLLVVRPGDPRCPAGQLENYLSRLDELEKPHELHVAESDDIDGRVHEMATILEFVQRHVRP